MTPQQLKAARTLVGWTQCDLAIAAGLSHVAIKKIEQGLCNPRRGTLDKIRKALKAKTDTVSRRDFDVGALLRKFSELEAELAQIAADILAIDSAGGTPDKYKDMVASLPSASELPPPNPALISWIDRLSVDAYAEPDSWPDYKILAKDPERDEMLKKVRALAKQLKDDS